MIALDTGFLYALVDADDAWHGRAMAMRHSAEQGWITTWPVLTEACWLMGDRLGPDFPAALMQDVAEGNLSIWSPPREAVAQVPALMRRYASLPMDLADASLVLLAEHLGHGQILSTDEREFNAYRWKQHKPFHNMLA